MLKEWWKEHVTEHVKAYKVNYQGQLIEPNVFEQELKRLVDRLISQVENDGVNDLTLDQIKARMELSFQANSSESVSRQYQALKGHYANAYRLHEELIHVRKQEAWADLKERVRYLVFRIFTTVGIAAVILLTAWVAQYWELPLPMLRVVSL